jgi:hypothetical protein
MDFNSTIDLIIKDLQEAVKIIDDLKKYQGIPVLQVELAKAKCKSAGEVIALLKTMNIDSPALSTEQQIPVVENNQEIVAEKKKQSRPQKSSAPEISEPEKTESLYNKSIQTPVVTKPESVKPAKKEQAPVTLGESFTNQKESFHDKLSVKKSEEDVTEMHKSKPIKSLSEAIGVNDRFLFIREIFNGNTEAFNMAVARLENAESINDAKAVIMSYTGDNQENEAVKQLIDLVKRKLPSDE